MSSANSSRSRASVPHRTGEADAGRRRDVPGVGLEHLADEALGRVGDEADPAARPGDPGELVRRALLVGREHRAEHRCHDVEARVAERQRLGIGLDVVGGQALDLGPAARPIEQRGHVVDADDRAAAARGGHRGVAAAGGDVEDGLGRMDVERFDEQLGHEQDLGPDHVVVAARPGRLLACLDGGEVGLGRGLRRDDGHGVSRWWYVDTHRLAATARHRIVRPRYLRATGSVISGTEAVDPAVLEVEILELGRRPDLVPGDLLDLVGRQVAPAGVADEDVDAGSRA